MFSIKPTVQRVTWSFGANDRLFAQRYLVTPNPEIGMAIQVLPEDAREGHRHGRRHEHPGQGDGPPAGNRRSPASIPSRGTCSRPEPSRAGRGGGRGRGPGYSPELWAPLGEYVITLEVGGQNLTQKATITKTQGWSVGAQPEIIR